MWLSSHAKMNDSLTFHYTWKAGIHVIIHQLESHTNEYNYRAINVDVEYYLLWVNGMTNKDVIES